MVQTTSKPILKKTLYVFRLQLSQLEIKIVFISIDMVIGTDEKKMEER
jgi:hypothetical protein